MLENESVWKEGEENNVIDFFYIYIGVIKMKTRREANLCCSLLSLTI